MNTNFDDLFNDLDLDQSQDILWLMHYQGATHLSNLHLNDLWTTSKNIFLLHTEHENVDELIGWKDDERIQVFAPVFSQHPRIHTFHFWFNWMQEIETHLNFVDNLYECPHKKYKFDCLLGTQTHHRMFIQNKILQHDDRHQFLIGRNPIYNVGVEYIRGCHEETDDLFVYYNGNQKTQSPCVIPYLIYNSAWFTIVAETTGNGNPFYTEKTGKALLGKRLFVLFGCHNHLKHLKDIGFKTFNHVIDESYDSIEDDDKRYEAAWQQVERLLQADPIRIYKKVKPVLEHNHKHFMSKSWTQDTYQKIKDISGCQG